VKRQTSESENSPRPPDPDAWPCPRCRQWVDRRFGVCWNCGTTVQGDSNPQFEQNIDRIDVESVDQPLVCPAQFHLSTLLWLTSIVAVAMSVGVSLGQRDTGFIVGLWLLVAMLSAHALRDFGPMVVRNTVAAELILLLFFILSALHAKMLPS
jgi:hypothetical protein